MSAPATFKNWREIKEWAEKNGYKNLAARMQLNNDAWMSSGEFGRSQEAICDALRFAKSAEDQQAIAAELDKQTAENYGLY